MRRFRSLTQSVAALAAAVTFWAANLAAADSGGLQTVAAVDMTGAFKLDPDNSADDRFVVREAEISLFAPVDHVFDGVLSLAAHPEGGETVFEVHEANISSAKLIPRSKIKGGQFFLGIGRLNQVHRHDWPFISAPKVHVTFFGEEGALDSGLQYSLLLPTSFFLDVTLGVTNGWTYGHSHDEGAKPRQPTNYARIASFVPLPGDGDVQIAVNHLGRRSADGQDTKLLGLDFVGKWSGGSYTKVLLQSEIWKRRQQALVGEGEENLGAYLYPQYGFSAALFLGMRLDYFSVPTLKDGTGAKVANADYGAVPTLTYKVSEFSMLRLAYTHQISTEDGQDDHTDRSLETQAVFILGAHPAHDF